jgi:hypothetical protein
MATKADFTEQEWETLEKGVTGAGFLVALSDRGFFDTFKEAGALSKHLREAQKQPSELVREFAETRGTGFGVTDRPDEIERETMAALAEAGRILDQKAPDEKEAYRNFVLDVAQSVADAAGGGEAAESATIEKIKAALG